MDKSRRLQKYMLGMEALPAATILVCLLAKLSYASRRLTTLEPSRTGPAAHADLHHLDELGFPSGSDSGEVVRPHSHYSGITLCQAICRDHPKLNQINQTFQ